MRAPTPSEKRLALLLGTTLFLVANLFALNTYLTHSRILQSGIAEAEVGLVEQEIWLEEADFWAGRQAWLDANQPQLPEDGSAGTRLQEFVREAATRHGIQILQQSLAEPVAGPDLQEFSVQLRVSGNLEALARWLTEIQQPGLFHAITAFNLKSDREPPAILCELQVARWYRP